MKRFLIGLVLIGCLGMIAWMPVTQNQHVTGKTQFDAPVYFNIKTLDVSGPTDNVDVSGVNILELDTSSNNVTVGGLTGGVEGQILHVIDTSTSGNATLEDSENTTYQTMNLSGATDEATDEAIGGWSLFCDGDDWFEID